MMSFFKTPLEGASVCEVRYTKRYTQISYCKVANSNIARLGAHACFFRLLTKGIFDPYVL